MTDDLLTLSQKDTLNIGYVDLYDETTVIVVVIACRGVTIEILNNFKKGELIYLMSQTCFGLIL